MTNPIKKTTILDVAKECGVSATTVSYALRNHPKISEQTKQKIREAAERLNYRRNPMVSALMSSLSQSRGPADPAPLAVVCTNSGKKTGTQYQQRLWKGISQRAEELGFSTEQFFLDYRKIDSKRISQIFITRGISGLILLPASRGGAHLSLDWNAFSAVAIGYSLLRPNLDRICHDQYQEIRLALKQIYSLGYKRPGLLLCPKQDLRSLYSWSSGFYGYEYPRKKNRIIPVLDYRDQEGLLNWYRKYQPDVIIGTDNYMLKQAGLKYPDDLGFVTLGYKATQPEIAGIDEQTELLGAAAVNHLTQLLYNNIRGIPDSSCTVLIQPKWVDGASLPRHDVSAEK